MSQFCVYASPSCELTPVQVAKKLGLVSDGQAASRRVENIQEPLEPEEVALAQNDGWSIVTGDSGLILAADPTEALSSISKNGRAVMWLTQSASGGLWFELHENSSIVRKWVQVEGEVVENIGSALPEEPEGMFGTEANEDCNEWKLLELAGAVVGVPWEEMGLQGEVFSSES